MVHICAVPVVFMLIDILLISLVIFYLFNSRSANILRDDAMKSDVQEEEEEEDKDDVARAPTHKELKMKPKSVKQYRYFILFVALVNHYSHHM